MEIRDAIFNDLESLLPLAHEAHQNSIFAGMEMNDAILQRNFVTAIQFDDGFAKVIVKDNKVIGGMVGMIIENHFGIRCAVDLFTYAHVGTDRLIRAFKRWAMVRAAMFVQITDLSGNPKYHKLIAGLGFEQGGVNFIGVT